MNIWLVMGCRSAVVDGASQFLLMFIMETHTTIKRMVDDIFLLLQNGVKVKIRYEIMALGSMFLS